MARFTRSDDLGEAEFVAVNLRGARFVESDLTGVVMRGVEVRDVDIDAPWLPGSPLLVNGVDVVPFVEAELDRRYPGRGQRYAEDPDELRVAWEVLQATWSDVLARAAAMPEGTVDISVAGEWTFSQTLRHLVLATDVWLRRAVLGVEQPFHPIGQLDEGTAAGDGVDLSVFTTEQPTYEEVLRVRAERVAMVRDFLAGVTVEELAVERANPWAPQYPETTRSCLHTILEEEWEHLRYAVRDLDQIEASRA